MGKSAFVIHGWSYRLHKESRTGMALGHSCFWNYDAAKMQCPVSDTIQASLLKQFPFVMCLNEKTP